MMRYVLPALYASSRLAHAAVDWQDCADAPFYFDDNAHGQQCAQLDVPLSYQPDHRRANPHDPRTVTLALSRLPATGKKIGSLVFITGGPGQTAVYPIESMDIIDELRENFDLVYYDARGIGYSQPAIRCRDEDDNIPDDPQAFVNACRAHTPAHFLPHIGSDEATNDVEQIRLALGEARINLIGYSYGTKIAAQYALRFPEHVRAIILDGVVDIFENSFSMRLHQQKGFQQAFAAFVRQCRQNPPCPFDGEATDSDILRALLYQDAWLRLRQTQENARWQHRWQAALEHGGNLLIAGVQSALTGYFDADIYPPEDSLPDYDDFINVLQSNLLWQEHWAGLDHALRSYFAGDSTYIAYLNGDLEDSAEGLIAIDCADMARPMRPGENAILQRRLQHAAPYDNLLDGFDPRKNLDPCGYWPYLGGDYRHSLPAQAPAALPPLLFIAQRHDPTTPWHNAKRMADYFRSPLITLEGHGHSLIFSEYNACMDTVATDYLLDPHQKPSQNTCTKDEEDLPYYHVYPERPWW